MNPPGRRWTIAELNAMDGAEFTRIVGPVYEHSPWIAEATWARRPFASLDALHRALSDTVANAGEARQLALLRAHPDLVGRAAQAGTLTASSSNEQASAGLDQLTAGEIAQFQKYNAAYRARFDFPFILCARQNKKEAILEKFPMRLERSRVEEIQTALDEVAKIARLRLEDLLQG